MVRESLYTCPLCSLAPSSTLLVEPSSVQVCRRLRPSLSTAQLMTADYIRILFACHYEAACWSVKRMEAFQLAAVSCKRSVSWVQIPHLQEGANKPDACTLQVPWPQPFIGQKQRRWFVSGCRITHSAVSNNFLTQGISIFIALW